MGSLQALEVLKEITGAGTGLALLSMLRIFFPKDDNRPRGAT